MKQASLYYFKVLPKRRRGRPLKNHIPLPMFAVLPKKTKATKELRDTDTEDSVEEDGGAEKDVEVEVDEVGEVDDEVADPKKKRPCINWRTPVHRETLIKAMQEGGVARDYMSVPRTTIIYYQDLMTATGKSIDKLLSAYGCPPHHRARGQVPCRRYSPARHPQLRHVSQGDHRCDPRHDRQTL
jgi:hypothetical protein